MPSNESFVASPPDNNLNTEVAGWLSDMIEGLPTAYREAVRLAELDELPQREIASRLGLTLSAAKSRIQRGRRLLREALDRCCSFQLDERGNVIDFQERGACARCCDDDDAECGA